MDDNSEIDNVIYIDSPYNDQIAVTGNLTTIISAEEKSLIRCIRWLGNSLRDLYRVTIYSPTTPSTDNLQSLIGYCNDQPVYQKPLVIHFQSNNTLYVAELVENSNPEFITKNGYIIDFGDFIYSNTKDLPSDAVIVNYAGNELQPESTNDYVKSWTNCSITAFATDRYQLNKNSITRGSKTLPYRSGSYNTIKIGNYTFTNIFRPIDLSGARSKDIVDQCIKNLITSVKPYNLIINGCYHLKIRTRDLNKYLPLVTNKLESMFKDQHMPIIEAVEVSTLDDELAIGGIFYVDDKIVL